MEKSVLLVDLAEQPSANRPSARVAASGVCPHPCQGDAQRNFHFVQDALFASGFRSCFLFQ